MGSALCTIPPQGEGGGEGGGFPRCAPDLSKLVAAECGVALGQSAQGIARPSSAPFPLPLFLLIALPLLPLVASRLPPIPLLPFPRLLPRLR